MKNKKLCIAAVACLLVFAAAGIFCLNGKISLNLRSTVEENDTDKLSCTQQSENSEELSQEEEELLEVSSDISVSDEMQKNADTESQTDGTDESDGGDDEQPFGFIDYEGQEETAEYWREYAEADDDIWKPDTEKEETAEFEYPDGWLEYFNQKTEELKTMFPEGKYWNSMGCGSMSYLNVTDIPCSHSDFEEIYCNTYDGLSSEAYPYVDTSTQCWGFSSMLSDYVFGEAAPAVRFLNYDNIHIGDQAVIYNNSHTVFIIDKTDEYVVVAECNADYETCRISWGRKIPREELTGFYITRWDW